MYEIVCSKMGNKKKNIFIISSWYPSEGSPLSGIFVKEQVEALAIVSRDEFNYIVSDWGFYDADWTPRKPFNAFKKIVNYFRTKRNQFREEKGVYYVSNPFLNISGRVPYFGNVERLVAVNYKNAQLAKKRLGPTDLIHAHVSYPGGYIAYRLSNLLDIPYILTEHMGPFPFKQYLTDGKPIKELDEAVRNADAVIAVSESLADTMSGFGYQNSVFIPNYVDEETFKPSIKQKNSKPFRFLSLSALNKSKGIGDLIKAIKVWSPSEEKIQFVIAGDGEDRGYFQQMANELGVDSLISWVGNVDRENVPMLMNECDAFVLPSHHESFGIVYVEAIASGKPIIATRCGGPESIVDEMNGLLVSVSDPVALADAMNHIYMNIHLYDSDKIREDFLERFSKKAVLKQIIDQYSMLINQ